MSLQGMSISKLFEKKLTPTDTTKRLSVPSRALPMLVECWEGHSANLRVMFKKTEWPISCTKRRKGYDKPVLSKGWVRFVRRNRLKVGDKVAFYKEPVVRDGHPVYRIRVERVTITPNPHRNDRVEKKRRAPKQSGKPYPNGGNCRYNSQGDDSTVSVFVNKERMEMAGSSSANGGAEENSLAPQSLPPGGLIRGGIVVGSYGSASFQSESFWALAPWSHAPGGGLDAGSVVSGSLISLDGFEAGGEASSWTEFAGSNSEADEMEGPNLVDLELRLAPPTIDGVAHPMELNCIDFLGSS